MAIERPHVGKFGAHQVVCVHVMVPRHEVQPAMHAALNQITAALTAQGVAPTAPWFAHHHRRPADTFDFDVCFPVDRHVELSGQLKSDVVPETVVVRTAYHGPYDGLPRAWPEFIEWIKAHNHSTRPDFFEVYSVGPRQSDEPSAWQTDLIVPLVGATAEMEPLV